MNCMDDINHVENCSIRLMHRYSGTVGLIAACLRASMLAGGAKMQVVPAQCSDSAVIQLPGLLPVEYLGAGANGFVLKVTDESNNYSALKIFPIVVKSNEGKTAGIMREREFYKYLAKEQKTPNLARATAWWSIDNVEKSVYLKWNKSLRRQLKVPAQDHPSHIVKNTTGEFKLSVIFVRMEYYASGNLRTWLECNSDKCGETYALRIQFFRDILSAVDFLHERGLMHRDICPNNIFLAEDNERLHAILGDFDSIVSCGEQALWPLTRVREACTRDMGTDPYAAPEIDGGYYDKQCDLFSLGVVALNLFFNIQHRKALRHALYEIREKDVYPTCIFPDDINLWVEVLRSQLSNTPGRRMSSCELMKLMPTRKSSLYLVAIVSNAVANLKDCRWVEQPPMPGPKRTEFRVAACAGKMYVVGGMQDDGQSSSIVQQYDTQAGWRNWPPMLEPRGWCGAAALGGRLFAVGGLQFSGTALSSAEECDLETGRWRKVAPMTAARFDLGVASVGSLLFAVGGFNGGLLNSAEWYDPRAGRWTKTAPMHEPHGGCGCAALGDRLYVAGGRAHYEKWTASVEWFDLRAGKWTRVRDMGAPRSHFALAALNGQLLAAGGKTSLWEDLDTVEVYNEKQNVWSTLDVRLPRADLYAGCVVEE